MIRSGREGSLRHPGDDLATQALPVECALTGNDQVAGLHHRLEADRVEHGLHAADPTSSTQEKAVSQPAARPGPGFAVQGHLLAGE